MSYYLPAVLVTMLLCWCHTIPVPLANGAEAKCFSSWKTAFFVLLPLTLLAVFRWNVGADSLYGESYWQAYQEAPAGLNLREFEIGFYWLLRLFSKHGVPFYWFLFALALLFMLCVSVAISEGSVSPHWSILIFVLLAVYFDCYSSLRQSLAEAICLIGWAEVGYTPASKQKNTSILLLFVFAGFFHQIALMNIPIYLLGRIRFSRKTLLKIVAAVVIFSPVLQSVLRFAMELFASERYEYMGVARINAAMTGVLAALCWYFYDEICALDENAYQYVNQSIYIFVLILNSGAMFLPFRVFDMLKIGYVFIIPYLLRGIRSGRVRLYVEIGMMFIFGAWFFNYYFIQDSFVTDYQTVFQDWNYIIHLP